MACAEYSFLMFWFIKNAMISVEEFLLKLPIRTEI